MTRPALRIRLLATKPNAGFVIIGVVMFVLALTILGLSLFGLSSYEAQFLHRSKHQLQALYHAQGGIERARYALSVHGLLEKVAEDLPPYVVSAEAFQQQGIDLVSSGPIQWPTQSDTIPVLVRVTASYQGVTRTLESRFVPQKEDDYYKRAFTLADSMYVNDISGLSLTNRCGTVYVHGGIRIGGVQSADDTSWVACMQAYYPTAIDLRSVAKPNVDQFFASHPTSQVPSRVEDAGGVDYFFSSSGAPEYYTWNTPGVDFTVEETADPTNIYVSGDNVWMLDKGLRIDGRVNVLASGPNASLVIVAGQNGSYSYGSETWYDAGIWFFGGIESNIPIVLVTDGGVFIEQYQHTNLESQQIASITVYAGYAFITGPQLSAAAQLYLRHGADTDVVVERLSSLGALPGALSTSGSQFTLVPGSWQELASN